MAWMLITITFGDEAFDGLADQLRPRVTEQIFGLGIHRGDFAILVHYYHRIRGEIEKGTEFGFNRSGTELLRYSRHPAQARFGTLKV